MFSMYPNTWIDSLIYVQSVKTNKIDLMRARANQSDHKEEKADS